jgi:flagellar biosynthetic protein FliQ
MESSVDVINIARQTIWVVMLVSGPMMVTALVIGLTVSIIQALTQIQETTLTFVPKVGAMMAVLLLAMPFMLQSLEDFTHELFDRIATIEQ